LCSGIEPIDTSRRPQLLELNASDVRVRHRPRAWEEFQTPAGVFEAAGCDLPQKVAGRQGFFQPFGDRTQLRVFRFSRRLTPVQPLLSRVSSGGQNPVEARVGRARRRPSKDLPRRSLCAFRPAERARQEKDPRPTVARLPPHHAETRNGDATPAHRQRFSSGGRLDRRHDWRPLQAARRCRCPLARLEEPECRPSGIPRPRTCRILSDPSR
jgi:hypothetical protein